MASNTASLYAQRSKPKLDTAGKKGYDSSGETAGYHDQAGKMLVAIDEGWAEDGDVPRAPGNDEVTQRQIAELAEQLRIEDEAAGKAPSQEEIDHWWNADDDDWKEKRSIIKYPGNDPTKPPSSNFEWRGQSEPGGGKGNWYNPQTGEKWNPDLNHNDPVGPHWDYTDSNGNRFRIFPDGRIERK